MSVQGYIRLKGKGVVFESNTFAYHDHAVFRRVAKEQRVHDFYRFEVDESALEQDLERASHVKKAEHGIPALVRRFRRTFRTRREGPFTAVYTVTFRGGDFVASANVLGSGPRRYPRGRPSHYKFHNRRDTRGIYLGLINSLVSQGYVEDHPRKDATERIDELLRVAFGSTPDRSDRWYEKEKESQLNQTGKWFPPQLGLKSVEALLKYLTKNREELDTANNRASPAAALKDLQAIRRVLKKASASRTPFRLFFS